MQASRYNASVIEWKDGKLYGIFVAAINAEGKMLRSNSIQCSGYEESPEYDAMIRRRFPDLTFEIRRDNCAAYKAAISGLDLPPAYK